MCHICAKELLDSNFNKGVIYKISVLGKLPQISHIHKNRNLLSIIGLFFLDQTLLPYKFHGGDMRGVYFFHFCQL